MEESLAAIGKFSPMQLYLLQLYDFVQELWEEGGTEHLVY